MIINYIYLKISQNHENFVFGVDSLFYHSEPDHVSGRVISSTNDPGFLLNQVVHPLTFGIIYKYLLNTFSTPFI